MRRLRKAKIVATLGPASSDKETIRALFDAGVDVFRFNFSHGSHEDHRTRYDVVREIEKEVGRPIAILADMQGPKLRIGKFANGKVALEAGAKFTLDRDPSDGNDKRVCLPHPELFAVVTAGQNLSLDDGKLRLRVIESDDFSIKAEVVTGGFLSDRKGVNVPEAILPIPVLTEKDHRDLRFALSLGVDWIALSFVQQPEDLHEAREIIAGRAGLMTKLEKPAALDRLDEIVQLSDAVMVARGDLGVELPPERVPGIQKRILRACRYHGKPSIIATQMLESMIHSPTPTRAEASDVASAIYDGADAVMLSAESASGSYPVQAVSIMERIIIEVERDPIYHKMLTAQHGIAQMTQGDAICAALRHVSQNINAATSVTYTASGTTSLRAARERPASHILSITPNLTTARRMALTWGVHSALIEHDVADVDEMVEAACRVSVAEGFAKQGDLIVIAAGMPFGESGSTNLLRIAEIK
ncbi:MAG: pyruvate kinase [Oxalobacter sp.]|nr:MAG: pyruvate kinase [Oxalobacter sp.]